MVKETSSPSLERRTLLTSIVASTSGISIASGSAVATQATSDELTAKPASLTEVTFVSDVDQRELSSPPSVFCQSDGVVLDDKRRAYAPEHLSASSGDLIVNSHEGAMVPRNTKKGLFSEIPIEASPEGQFVSIPGSNSPDVSIERQNGTVSVTFGGEEFTVSPGGSLERQVSTDVDAISRKVTLDIRVNDIGDVEVITHPSKKVIPMGTKMAASYKRLANKTTSGRREGNRNQELLGDVGVTALKEDGVLLVDTTGGDQA